MLIIPSYHYIGAALGIAGKVILSLSSALVSGIWSAVSISGSPVQESHGQTVPSPVNQLHIWITMRQERHF